MHGAQDVTRVCRKDIRRAQIPVTQDMQRVALEESEHANPLECRMNCVTYTSKNQAAQQVSLS